MINKIENAKKLIKDVNKKKRHWNERSSFTLKHVKNLSMSDLDTLELYALEFIKNDGCGFSNLMRPVCKVKEVLEIYQIV